jgi:MraZ protein
MFNGRFEHNIDEKGRLVLPNKFRVDLTEGAMITKGFDGCLQIYTAESWNQTLAELRSKPFTSQTVRDFKRVLIGNASDVVLDKAGRINIPNYLLKLAGISKEVTIVGMDETIEIWSTEVYIRKQTSNEDSFEANAEQLSFYGREN